MADKILKVLLFNDTDGALFHCDAIEHEGSLWLVPHWLEAPAIAVSKPARMVRIDHLPRQPGGAYGDYVLNAPVPKVLLERATPRGPVVGFEYRELPDVEIPASVRPLEILKKPSGAN